MTTSNKGTFQPDSDVHITYDDQQKINKFARLNAKLEDLKDEVQAKENDLENIEEACDEISFLDDDEKIPYQVGEVFIYQDHEKTQKCLEQAKKEIREEISQLLDQAMKVKHTMGDLKSHLYGKFGSHINLESDE